MGLISNLSQTEWEIDCTDTFDRPRTTTVRARRATVVVQFPAGEAAQFTPEQLAAFRSALLQAGYRAGQEAGRE